MAAFLRSRCSSGTSGLSLLKVFAFMDVLLGFHVLVANGKDGSS